MPVVKDRQGRYAHVSRLIFTRAKPAQFLDGDEYRLRVKEARYRVLETIRFLDRPLCGRGMNHSVHGVGSSVDDLVDYIDQINGQRCRRVRMQPPKKPSTGLGEAPQHIRSPQNMWRRRRALFSLDDLPNQFFNEQAIQHKDYEPFVDLMRWHLLRYAIEELVNDHEIEHVGDVWSVKVSTIDKHFTNHRSRSRRRTKQFGRPTHRGQPQRGARRVLTAA